MSFTHRGHFPHLPLLGPWIHWVTGMTTATLCTPRSRTSSPTVMSSSKLQLPLFSWQKRKNCSRIYWPPEWTLDEEHTEASSYHPSKYPLNSSQDCQLAGHWAEQQVTKSPCQPSCPSQGTSQGMLPPWSGGRAIAQGLPSLPLLPWGQASGEAHSAPWWKGWRRQGPWAQVEPWGGLEWSGSSGALGAAR